MTWKTIEKPRQGWAVIPNLVDYERTRAAFLWEVARRALDGLPDGGLNIAMRRLTGMPRGRCAIIWRCAGSASGAKCAISATASCARRLTASPTCSRRLGVGEGERVFLLAGRIPELYISALGTLKNGSVFCPLFSAFGPEPIRQRIGSATGACWSPQPRFTNAKSRSCAHRCPV